MILWCFFVQWSLLWEGRLTQLTLLALVLEALLWEERSCRFEHHLSKEDLDRTPISFFPWVDIQTIKYFSLEAVFQQDTHLFPRARASYLNLETNERKEGSKYVPVSHMQKCKSGKKKNLSSPLCLLISHWLLSTDAALPYSEVLLLGKGCTAA